MTRVFAAVFGHQVLQAEGPLLLPSLTHFFRRQRPAVLQPDDVRSGVAAGRALEPHGAAHWTGNHTLSHFGWLCEAGPHYKVRGEKR